MYREIPFAKDIIRLIDTLIVNKDTTSLRAVHDINVTFILGNIIDPDISIIEINEYIEEAIIQLEGDDQSRTIQKASDKFLSK